MPQAQGRSGEHRQVGGVQPERNPVVVGELCRVGDVVDVAVGADHAGQIEVMAGRHGVHLRPGLHTGIDDQCRLPMARRRLGGGYHITVGLPRTTNERHDEHKSQPIGQDGTHD